MSVWSFHYVTVYMYPSLLSQAPQRTSTQAKSSAKHLASALAASEAQRRRLYRRDRLETQREGRRALLQRVVAVRRVSKHRVRDLAVLIPLRRPELRAPLTQVQTASGEEDRGAVGTEEEVAITADDSGRRSAR